MNSDNLKITIHAEGCSATDLLKILGGGSSGSVATSVTGCTESTAIPTWVSEFREAIMRLEETIEKNNSCRLGAQKQIIAQYEGLTSQVAGITSQVAGITSQIGDISSKVGGVSLEVTGLSARCDALSAQCSTLSERCDALANSSKHADSETVTTHQEVLEAVAEVRAEEAAAQEEVEEEQLADAAAEEEEVEVEEEEEEEVEVEEEEEVEVEEEEEAEEEQLADAAAEVEEEQLAEEEAEEEGLEEFEYKGKTYYKDSENTVYTLDENDEPVPRGIWNEAKQLVQFYKTVAVK